MGLTAVERAEGKAGQLPECASVHSELLNRSF